MVDNRKVNVKGLEDIENVPLPVYADLQVIHREEWGALPRKVADGVQEEPLKTPIPYVTITHSGTEPCTSTKECKIFVKEMQRRDMEERGLSDIQYSYIIGGDARIYQGRGWDVPPPENPHHPELYGKCLEFLFVGTYDVIPMPGEMVAPAYDLVQILKWDDIIHTEMKIKRLITFARHPEKTAEDFREVIARPMARPAPGCVDCTCVESTPVKDSSLHEEDSSHHLEDSSHHLEDSSHHLEDSSHFEDTSFSEEDTLSPEED